MPPVSADVSGVCAEAIFRALAEIEEATGSRPEVRLYRGAWEEWSPHEIDMAVPLSPVKSCLSRLALLPERIHVSILDAWTGLSSSSRDGGGIVVDIRKRGDSTALRQPISGQDEFQVQIPIHGTDKLYRN